MSQGRDRRWLVAVCVAVGLTHVPAIPQYYHCDDGILLLVGTRVAADESFATAAFGFNGHFRPLPVALAGSIFALFGAHDPAPFHVAGLAIHLANVAMVWSFARRLAPGRTGVAVAAAALFGLHGDATEAATYFAGCGVAIATFGGLVVARAALELRSDRVAAPLVVALIGVAVAAGGGEYWIATIPMAFACAAWPTSDSGPAWRRVAILAAALLPCLAAYVLFEKLFLDHGRLGSVYRMGWHLPTQLGENLLRLVVPGPPRLSRLLQVLPWVAAVGALAWWGRPWPTSRWPAPWRATLIAAATVGALLPFAPSLAGNYPRFLYPALPLAAFGMVVAVAACLPADRVRWVGPVALIGTLAIHQTAFAKRLRHEGERASSVHQMVRLVSDRRPAEFVVVPTDAEHVAELVTALGLVERGKARSAAEPIEPSADRLVVRHAPSEARFAVVGSGLRLAGESPDRR